MKLGRDFFVYAIIVFIALDIALTTYLLSNLTSNKVGWIIVIVNLLFFTTLGIAMTKIKKKREN